MANDEVKLLFTTVDVFTTARYEGNPLAIVELPPAVKLSKEQKQTIAREFNFSETVFLHSGANDNSWRVDIFTTTAELPFAGHPTIGTACFALARSARKGRDAVVTGSFSVKAGKIDLEYDTASRTAGAAIPHNVRVHQDTYSVALLQIAQPALQKRPQECPVVSIVKGMTFVLIELESLEELGRLQLPQDVRGVRLDEGWESFVGAYFYVKLGQDTDGLVRIRTRMLEGNVEDPATGSAACTLASYLALQNRNPGHTVRFELTQGVEMGRRSVIGVNVALNNDGRVSTVILKGSAIEVTSGEIIVPPAM